MNSPSEGGSVSGSRTSSSSGKDINSSEPVVAAAPSQHRVQIARLPDTSNREERKRIPQACETCRLKKCRCDGAQPVCKKCATNSTPCRYGLAKGLRSKRLLEDLSQKVAVYERLFDGKVPGTPADGRDLTYDAQSASPTPDSESVASPTGAGKRIRPRPVETSMISERQVVSSPQRAIESATPMSATRPYASTSEPDEVMGGTQMEWRNESTAESWGIEYAMHSKSNSIPPKALAERAARAFFQGATVIFEFFTEQEKAALMDDVYSVPSGPASNIALCQLCAVAAVGCRYDPDSFSHHDREAFLAVAKSNLEETIEAAPLCAMRALAVLAMYFTFEKRTTAHLYLDMGLKLARVNRVEVIAAVPEYFRWKRTLNSLILIDTALGSTTGHVPETPNLDLHRAVLMAGARPDGVIDAVQVEIAKISYLTGLILRDICHAESVSSSDIVMFKHRLEEWQLNLPHFMRLDALLGEETSQYLRPMFLLHLMYLSTSILMYRWVLVDQTHGGRLTIAPGMPINVQEYVGLSLWNSRQAARLLDLVRAQNLLVKRGLIFTDTAYRACNVLLFFVANMLQSSELGLKEAAEDLAVAGRCVDILDYCEAGDETGQNMGDLKVLYEGLKETAESRRIGSDEAAAMRAKQSARGRDSLTEESHLQVLRRPDSHGQDDGGRLHGLVRLATKLLMHPFEGADKSRFQSPTSLQHLDTSLHGNWAFLSMSAAGDRHGGLQDYSMIDSDGRR